MKDFKSAYPGTSDRFHLALENTCKEIERMNSTGRKHMRRTTMLVAALIAVLMLAGLAYAAVQSRLLEDLFFNRTPNREAQQLVKSIGQSVTQEGITLTLGDYLVDGDEWYLSYSVESEREDTVLLSTALGSSLVPDRPLIDDAGHHWLHVLGGSVDGVMMPNVYSETLDPWGREWDGRLKGREPFDVTVLVRVAKPRMQLVIWPKDETEQGDDYGISDREWASFKKNEQLPVYGHGVSPFPSGIQNINRASEVGTMKVCEDAGTVEPLTELRLSVTIDPAKGSRVTHVRLVEPQRFEFADYALEVNMIDLTPTSSIVDFNVIPNQWLDESGLTKEAYVAKFGRDYALLNADGQNLNGQEAGAMFNAYEQILIEEKYVPYSCSGPLSELPETLVLAPVVWGEGEWPDRKILSYDMEHAVALKLGKLIPTFTAEDQPLPDIGPVMERFFGADAQKMETAQPLHEGCISYESPDGESRIDWNQQTGFFSMRKPSAIPTMYRKAYQMDNEQFPAPSGMPGKYTQQEAIELAKQFLSGEIGIDETLLVVGDVYPEDPRKERSCAYRILFGYRYDGINLRSQGLSCVHMDVTDEGVVFASGGALQIVP